MLRYSRFALVLLCALCHAEVQRVFLVDRTDVLGGRELGPAGAYERVVAKAVFTLDPANPANARIHDLDRAPRNSRGLVEFTADLYVLKPRDPAKSNGTLLFEVSNRGGKAMLSHFNYGVPSNDPVLEADFGDLWLMQQGYMLVWAGWQWDVPPAAALMRVDAPVAHGPEGLSITGPVRSEYIPAAATLIMPLSDRSHVIYPVSPQRKIKLTVRDTPLAERKEIPAAEWRLSAGRTSIEMDSRFQPGKIYEAVYEAEDPRVEGVGLAVVRDTVSYFKYGNNGLSLLGDQGRYWKHSIGFGISQSGRFLRTLLYEGMNQDEKGRKVFDGVWADVAGAGRGSFNQRFGQASRDGAAFSNLFYATDLFPFTDLPELDSQTGARAGLLDRIPEAAQPKIFYTNGSYEYWGRNAALIHIAPDGKADAPIPDFVRIYSMNGNSHGPGRWPPSNAHARYYNNPVDFRPYQRALLAALTEWVNSGKTPPESRYPRIDKAQLVPADNLLFPKRIGAHPPARPLSAFRLNFGADFDSKGIVTQEPPNVGPRFATMVPQCDADGIDVGGIRMPEVSVPLGAFTGWNFRPKEQGAEQEAAPLTGGFFPFSPREIRRRYRGREPYLDKVADAADQMIQDRFLLPADRARVIQQAGAAWDWVMDPRRGSKDLRAANESR